MLTHARNQNHRFLHGLAVVGNLRHRQNPHPPPRLYAHGFGEELVLLGELVLQTAVVAVLR
jgi:hypothetical protein